MVSIHFIEKNEINFMEGTNHDHITQHNKLCITSSHIEAFSTILKTESAMYAEKKTALTYIPQNPKYQSYRSDTCYKNLHTRVTQPCHYSARTDPQEKEYVKIPQLSQAISKHSPLQQTHKQTYLSHFLCHLLSLCTRQIPNTANHYC